MTKAMTLRLDDDLHEKLRAEAFEKRVSITSLIIRAIEMVWHDITRSVLAADLDAITGGYQAEFYAQQDQAQAEERYWAGAGCEEDDRG